jgi:putative FmdB family regulatory protein
MPTYDYVCDTCGETFEIFQSIKDNALTDCPKEDCNGRIKRKIGGGAGIIFKGSGFYQTDYRSASYNAGAKADKSSGTGSSSSASSSSSSSSSSSGSAASSSSSSGGAK